MTRRVPALAMMLVAGCETNTTPTFLPQQAKIDASVSSGRDTSRSTGVPSMPSAAEGDGSAFRVRWCSEEGLDPGLRLETLANAARGYERNRASDCHTRGLLPELDALQRRDWLDYLIGYSLLMLGCPPRSTPVPGGVLVFGPANTSAIGVPVPPLGKIDVERLAAYYLENLVAFVPLSNAERMVLEAQLWATAQLVVDANLAETLSECTVDGGL